ncbi:hypothetical protein CC1G_11963 [Coprinopsis cinerea okayama7|uniref:DUF4219 domain-containing protein n=1 Tax=Coprinopsis cinerea (strain Okayama-7 / 130 / ATCC MYA-4618 / FGSC 9003) TaxID=240176 RepID=A8PHK1_COPC7|nr:hypothetical protein CC1G_11963 [Coprinopsis cinerea okayama7\|eukprot:XP_001841420.2 hypothetical protein CC1G_11963 [Coprinopsis cinerea okayama7\
MSISANIDNHVMLFKGVDYNVWADQMQTYLEFTGLWNYTRSSSQSPIDPGESASNKEKNSYRAELNTRVYNEGTTKCMGAMRLRLHPDIRNHPDIKVCVGPFTLWSKIQELYGKPGLSVIYSDFKQAIYFAWDGNLDPRSEIARFQVILSRLTANKVELPEFVKGMLLLSSLPQKYDNVVSLALQTLKDMKDIKVDAITPLIITENERKSTKLSVNKATRVKQKKSNPKYKDQKKQSDAPQTEQQGQSKSNKDKKKIKCGKSSGKNKQHEHVHAAVADSDSDSNGPSYIASAAFLGSHVIDLIPHTPAPSTASIANFTKDGISVDKRPINLPAKAFTVATAKKMEETPVYSKFESIAQAQKICETHGVPKTARNLTAVLDIPRVSLAKCLESPPPAKRP